MESHNVLGLHAPGSRVLSFTDLSLSEGDPGSQSCFFLVSLSVQEVEREPYQMAPVFFMEVDSGVVSILNLMVFSL